MKGLIVCNEPTPEGTCGFDWEMIHGHNYGYDRSEYPPEAFVYIKPVEAE